MLGKYVFTAAMTIGADRDALLNEVYDTEHVPEILKIPHMISISRYRRTVPADTFYLAAYEIAAPYVPTGPGFMKARDIGRWPTEVRPHTRGLRNGNYAWQSGFSSEAGARVATPNLLFGEAPARVADTAECEAILRETLAALEKIPGVSAGAHYVDVRNGKNLLVAGFSAEVTKAVLDRAAPVIDAEIYAALGS